MGQEQGEQGPQGAALGFVPSVRGSHCRVLNVTLKASPLRLHGDRLQEGKSRRGRLRRLLQESRWLRSALSPSQQFSVIFGTSCVRSNFHGH